MLTPTVLAAIADEPHLENYISRGQARWMAQRILDLQDLVYELEQDLLSDPAHQAL